MTYSLYELFGPSFIVNLTPEIPIQLNDFIQFNNKLLQVKQIAHEVDSEGIITKVKLFTINIQTNEEVKRG